MDGRLFNGKKNVLWGAGEEGKKMLFDCMFQGIYIFCFCDSDPVKQGLRFLNKKICAPEEIMEHREEYNIIISVNKKNAIEVEEMLHSKGIKTVLRCGDVKCGIDYPGISYRNLYVITAQTHKKIVIYGTDRHAAEIAYILHYLDIKTDCFVSKEENTPFCHRPVKSFDSLLDEDEDTFLLILPQKNEMLYRKCGQLGLIFGKNVFVWQCLEHYNVAREYAIDPILGYNFSGGGTFSGTEFYGNPKAEFKVVTLGSSTTDPDLYYFKCWSEMFAELLMEKGIDVCVMCGGCGGYLSSQELIKLVRDYVPMHPDIVIDYTGYNDVNSRRETYLFHNRFHRELAEFLSGQAKDVNIFDNIVIDGYTLGGENHLSVWEEFEKNIRSMKAICDAFHIRYYAFLQPCLAVKALDGRLSAAEREVVLNSEWYTEKRLNRFREFYSHRQDSEEWITDFTEIFNGKNVYMDACHVTEEGNRIIAEAVFNELDRRGEIWK